MKITKARLAQLIREELENLEENPQLIPPHLRAGAGQPEVSAEEAHGMFDPPAGQEETLASVEQFLSFLDTLVGQRMTHPVLEKIKNMLKQVHPTLKAQGLGGLEE